MTIRTIRNMVSVPMLALLAASAGGQQVQAQTPPPYLHAPSVTDYATHNPDGRTILPTGRYLQPVGKHLPLAQWPHGMVLSPDGKTALVASEGVGQFITDWNSPEPTVISFLPGEAKRRSNAGGAVFSPDGKTLYWSSGESGEIHLVNVADHTVTGSISLNVEVGGRKFEDSFAMDIQASPDGSTLYIADVTNFRVITVDTAKGKVVGSIDVGRYPYALAVAGRRVYVANIGLFAYSAIPKPILPPKPGETVDPRGLTFPPFAFPSKEARDGVEVEGRQVPGLGDPNGADSFSVWGIDVADPAAPKVVTRLKTGLLIGAPADNGRTVGGSAPNFLVVHGNDLYVSNGNNDTIERIDLTTGKIVHRTRIQPSPLVAKLRGVGPSGMTLSADGSRLYVAESGINAIGVLDTRSGMMLGSHPHRLVSLPPRPHSGWQTAPMHLLPGLRQRSQGRQQRSEESLSWSAGCLLGPSPLPPTPQLGPMTQKVLAYNGMTDHSADRAKMTNSVVPALPGKPSEQIQYVVFITKENHTYDAIFDHVPGANSDPSLLRWGYHQTIAAPGQPTPPTSPS